MKRQLALVRATLILLVAVLLPLTPVLVTGADDVVTFKDANLERVIREALAKPEGNLLESDLAGLTQLAAPEEGIAKLDGLEH